MLRYFKYKTPFKKHFKTALGEFKNREGIVLVFEEKNIRAFGEVSPLPGFSKETLVQVEAVLVQNKKFLDAAFMSGDAEQIISVLDAIHQFPSLSFGLDTLYHDLQAKQEGMSFSQHLFKKKAESIPCNATIGIQSIEESISEIQSKKEEGFKTFKFKVGTNFELEKKVLTEARNQFPDIKIRIDANQGWTKKEAVLNLSNIGSLNIEYCEQPVPANDLEILKFVREKSPIKIAGDEVLGNISTIPKVIEDQCCDILILKPVLLGRFQTLFVTKKLADTHNIESVLTTAFDGIIGRVTTAIFASGLGSKKYAHGLATGFHLNEPGINAEQIENGCYEIPETNGIGNPIDINSLEEIV